jgi:hypothetical protein
MQINPSAVFQNGVGIPYVQGQAPFGIAQGLQQTGFPPLPSVPVYHAYAGQNVDQFMQQQQLQNVSPGVAVNGAILSPSASMEDNKRVLSPDVNQTQQQQQQQQGFYSSPPSFVVNNIGGLYYPNGSVPIANGLMPVDPLLVYSSPPKRLRKDGSPQGQGGGQGKHSEQQQQNGEEMSSCVEASQTQAHNKHHTSHNHNNHHQNHQNHHHNSNHGRGTTHGEKQI